jgi:mRNA interferase HicA
MLLVPALQCRNLGQGCGEGKRGCGRLRLCARRGRELGLRKDALTRPDATLMLCSVNSSQAKRFLAKRGAAFAPGKGGHLIVTLNGRRSILPQHGGSKELGKGLWLTILKQLDIKE